MKDVLRRFVCRVMLGVIGTAGTMLVSPQGALAAGDCGSPNWSLSSCSGMPGTAVTLTTPATMTVRSNNLVLTGVPTPTEVDFGQPSVGHAAVSRSSSGWTFTLPNFCPTAAVQLSVAYEVAGRGWTEARTIDLGTFTETCVSKTGCGAPGWSLSWCGGTPGTEVTLTIPATMTVRSNDLVLTGVPTPTGVDFGQPPVSHATVRRSASGWSFTVPNFCPTSAVQLYATYAIVGNGGSWTERQTIDLGKFTEVCT